MDSYSFAKSSAINIPPSVWEAVAKTGNKAKTGLAYAKSLLPTYFNFSGSPINTINGVTSYGYTPMQTLKNMGTMAGVGALRNEMNRGAALRDAATVPDTTSNLASEVKTNIKDPSVSTSWWGQLPTAAKVGLGVGVPSIALMIALEALDKPKTKGESNDDED